MTTANTMWDPNRGDVVNPSFNSLTVISGFTVASGGSATISGGMTVTGQLVTSGGQANPPITRALPLTETKTDAGVGITGAATATAFGVSRTAGTSMVLLGSATTATASTQKGLWELDLPGGYVSGTPLPVIVNQQINGAGTLVASACVLSVSGYSESISGTEAGLTTTISGGSATSAQMTTSAADLAFVVSGGAALVPGAHLVIEVSATVSNSAGNNTIQINGARIVA